MNDALSIAVAVILTLAVLGFSAWVVKWLVDMARNRAWGFFALTTSWLIVLLVSTTRLVILILA
jgi:hypothetical protein